MSKELKILLGIAILVIGGGALLFILAPTQTQAPGSPIDSSSLIRDNSHVVGPADAKVTIVEFGDFQCPGCAAVDPVVRRIIDEYAKTNKIRYAFRNFPLTSHPNAQSAAEAAEAAGSQGKYWEMHYKIYEGQKDWVTLTDATAVFQQYAKDLGLDMNKFNSEYERKFYSEIINADYDDGLKAGVNSTPTFFINGEKKSQVYTYDEFKKVIEELLAK